MSAPTTNRRGRPPRYEIAMSGALRQDSLRRRRAGRLKALEDGLRTALRRLATIEAHLLAGENAQARGVLAVATEDIQALVS